MLGASLLAVLSAGGQALAQSASAYPSDVRVNTQPQTASSDTSIPQVPASGALNPVSTPPDFLAPGALTMEQLNGYRQQLAVLNFQVQIKELQAKEAQADAQIKSAKAGNIGNMDGNSQFGSMMAPNMMRPVDMAPQTQSSTPAAPVFPTLQSMFGANGHMTATLNMPDGTTLNAQTGDSLPNGMKVVSISKSGVRVANGTQIVTIAFGAAPHADSSSDGSNNHTSGQPIPTMPNMPQVGMGMHMPSAFTPFGNSGAAPASSLDMGMSSGGGGNNNGGGNAVVHVNQATGIDALGNNHNPPPGAPGP